ncbi:TetR/AcrR family transcriptional regulator [Saccharothrix sp. ST-888]|uniref:TetR/AcrR family transcriptional regulator n=1 Tax=Saccharothrix sp. ST-888 TaxID=1427391 RepID=UPI0005EC3AB5|nr:TetR/AcrR family transcriptional regulator [Saccharothrix sp. ST-888]KJK59354.1 TetR family transcriptional regulator [Saccharothrix sp. ST-888]
MATRKYDQRLRAEASEETRRRILDAVATCLRETPAEPVGLDRVARLAGVARSTVYLVFGSRGGLFAAFGENLLRHSGFADMLKASAHPDAREDLRGGIHGVAKMYAAHRDVLRALHSMAMLDPDAVGGVIQRMDQGRAAGTHRRALRLADQGLLRPDVTVDEATAVLWLLMSFDSFDQLYTGRSLPADQVAGMLAATAERSLCR